MPRRGGARHKRTRRPEPHTPRVGRACSKARLNCPCVVCPALGHHGVETRAGFGTLPSHTDGGITCARCFAPHRCSLSRLFRPWRSRLRRHGFAGGREGPRAHRQAARGDQPRQRGPRAGIGPGAARHHRGSGARARPPHRPGARARDLRGRRQGVRGAEGRRLGHRLHRHRAGPRRRDRLLGALRLHRRHLHGAQGLAPEGGRRRRSRRACASPSAGARPTTST